MLYFPCISAAVHHWFHAILFVSILTPFVFVFQHPPTIGILLVSLTNVRYTDQLKMKFSYRQSETLQLKALRVCDVLPKVQILCAATIRGEWLN